MLKVFLIALVVVIGAVIIIPFILNITGVSFTDFGFGGGRGGQLGINGLLIRSTDNGKSWLDGGVSNDRLRLFPSLIAGIAFHPVDPDTVYLATKGNGLWTSTSSGAVWSPVRDERRVLLPNADVYRVAISRTDPRILYAAVFQEDRGVVLKSEDGGKSFFEVYAPVGNRIAVFDVLIDPVNSGHVIIATGQGGVLETLNGGKTWRAKGWLTEAVARFSANPFSFKEIYALTTSGRFFKSVDGGENWVNLTARFVIKKTASQGIQGVFSSPTPNPFFSGIQRHTIGAFLMDPQNPKILYASVREGLIRSADGGMTWEKQELLLPSGNLAIDAIAVHPRNSQTIFATVGNQIHRSDDGGMHWSIEPFLAKNRLRMLVVHPIRPEMMFAVVGR